MADLNQRGVTLTPPSSFWGGNGARLAASMPSSSSLLFETSYQRTPAELFQIQAAQDATDAQAIQSQIRDHAASIPQPRGFEIDAVRYYRCDDVFVAYIVPQKQALDPAVDKALNDTCAPAFARYPPK